MQYIWDTDRETEGERGTKNGYYLKFYSMFYKTFYLFIFRLARNATKLKIGVPLPL